MNHLLTLTLLQSELHWHNPAANLAMFEEKIWKIDQKTDLIILPEMFTTGFSMEAATFAEPMNLTTFKWMKQMASQTGAVLTGSYIVKDQGNYYNRLLWMQPDGEYKFYDKRHLFRLAGEEKHYTAGKKKIILQWKGWRICPLICYDLRFPVWSRNTDSAFDLLIYVANWPIPRANAWKILLQARAIENQCFVAGVNRVGKDGKEHLYSGDTSLIDFKGEILYQKSNDEDMVTLTLQKDELDLFRGKFPFYKDADRFEIRDELD